MSTPKYILFFLLLLVASDTKSFGVEFHPIASPKNVVEPVAFPGGVHIYMQPDTTGKYEVIDNARTPIHILQEGGEASVVMKDAVTPEGQSYQITEHHYLKWYQVAYANGIYYIKAEDVATHSFQDATGKNTYYVVTDFSNRYNPNRDGFRIYKFSRETHKYIDSLDMTSSLADFIISLNPAGWKNVDLLLHAGKRDFYCGGSDANVFIVDANGKLAELITTRTYYDDGGGDSYSSNVWLPVMFDKGKTMLLLNGDTEHAFDAYSGMLNTLPFPKEFSVPKMELVIMKEAQTESVMDKNGEPAKDKNDNYIYKTILDATRMYRWDGRKLVLLK